MRFFAALIVLLSCSLAHAADVSWQIVGDKGLKKCRQDFSTRLCRDRYDLYWCAKPVGKFKDYVQWDSVDERPDVRLFLQEINRRNSIIWRHHCIAFPREMVAGLPFDEWRFDRHSPMSLENRNYKEKVIIVDLRQLAWGAYENSRLVRWGVANGGRGRCKENSLMKCKTHVGTWSIIEKGAAVTKSDLYPVECEDKKECGHPLYWKLRFHRDGTALHGDRNVPGANLSHGCVRLLKSDAKWLNTQFAEVGTKIVVLPY